MEVFVVNRDEVSWRGVDDEAVIIHCTTSDYFALNQAGTWLWELMTEVPCTSAALIEALSSRNARADDEVANEVGRLRVTVHGPHAARPGWALQFRSG